jgi:hypothetical protein
VFEGVGWGEVDELWLSAEGFRGYRLRGTAGGAFFIVVAFGALGPSSDFTASFTAIFGGEVVPPDCSESDDRFGLGHRAREGRADAADESCLVGLPVARCSIFAF